MKNENGKEIYVKVCNKECVGCARHDEEIMLSFGGNNQGIFDFFMSNEEATALVIKLQTAIKKNDVLGMQ